MGVIVRADPALVSPYTRAELFWGLYERAECAYVDRFLNGSTCVVELGSGIGISSAHIAAGLSRGGVLVCVEANEVLLPSIEQNIQPYLRRSRSSGTIVHAAIGACEGTSILNVVSNPFESYVSRSAAPDAVSTVPVPTRSLESVLKQYPARSFDLVCDVEGAEGELIVRSSGLERCRRLIIELHGCKVDGEELTEHDLLAVLSRRWGFRLLARKGPVAALTR